MTNFWQKIKKVISYVIAYINAPKDTGELPSHDDKTTLKLGAIVGHEKSAPGATLAITGESEYSYNTKVAKLMQDYAMTFVPTMTVEVIYRDGIGISGAYSKAKALECDAVIELHFNAYNATVMGTETLSTSNADDLEFSKIIHSGVCQVFKRDGQSRGVKAIQRSARGGSNVYGFPSGPNCLVEPFFGDSWTEARLANEKVNEYASQLVKSVYEWAKLKGFYNI
jgi:N-acetylmuramoyl-L-alanine amidase